MKSLKKVCCILCLIALVINTVFIVPVNVNATFSEKLLSANTLGYALSANQATINTGATYSWLSEGTYATDSQLIADDETTNPDLRDGIAGDDGSYVTDSTWVQSERYGTALFDLHSVYLVSKVQVWAKCATNIFMKQFEVYASIDGDNYTSLGVKTNTNPATSGWAYALTLDIKPKVNARYIKIVAKKDASMYQMVLGEMAIFGDTAETESILSNNIIRSSNPYNGQPRIVTGATYQWVKDGPFATSTDITTSDNYQTGEPTPDPTPTPDPGVTPVPYNAGNLTDGDTTVNAYSTCSSGWGYEGKFATAIFDLKDNYQVSKIDLWSYADNYGQGSGYVGRIMDGYEVLVSTDGLNYSSLGYTVNTGSVSPGGMQNTVAHGFSGKYARYVKIIIHNAKDSHQLIVSEIAIWGYALYDKTLTHNSTPEQIEPTVTVKNATTAYIDWSTYNAVVNEASYYKVYVEEATFSSTSGKTCVQSVLGKNFLYFGLEPEKTYYIAVTPMYGNNSEMQTVTPVVITTPSIFGGDKVGDIFAINDAPDGNANHGFSEQANLGLRMSYLRDLEGVNSARWWLADPWYLQYYGRNGVNMHGFANLITDIPTANSNGIWSFETNNEINIFQPDGVSLSTWAASYATQIAAANTKIKNADSRNILCEPATGGFQFQQIDFIDALYNVNTSVKDTFDVMDIHCYSVWSNNSREVAYVPNGLELGVPETEISKISELRTVMQNHNDGNKPIIFSEFGWQTSNATRTAQFIPLTQELQRDYIARGYMIAASLGVKRAFLYGLEDYNDDPLNIETKGGLLDWNGIPKKSYYGFYTLIRELKDTKYIAALSNVSNPYYGYKFWNELTNEYVSSIWAANETTKTAAISTSDSSIDIIGIDGSYKHQAVTGGTVNVTITGSPIFIHSKTPITVTSIN